MKQVDVSGFPYYYCDQCKSYQKKTAAEVNLWKEQPQTGQFEIGCGICGLTASEISTIDLSGNSIVDNRALATPCQYCEGNYYQYESCLDCGGSGSHDCNDCDDGYSECLECSGAGQFECSNCQGLGETEEEEEERPELCSECAGNGYQECYVCLGDGRTQCDYCFGAGDFDCNDCDGSGRINCTECDDDGMEEYVDLEEWCSYWESSIMSAAAEAPSPKYLYPWDGESRPYIEWSDHCLAFGDTTDSLDLEVQKVGSNKDVWAYKSSNSWEYVEDTDQTIMNFCPICNSSDVMQFPETEDDWQTYICFECNQWHIIEMENSLIWNEPISNYIKSYPIEESVKAHPEAEEEIRRRMPKTSNAWEEETSDSPQLIPNSICPECKEGAYLYSIGYEDGGATYISACLNNHETYITEFENYDIAIGKTQSVEDALANVNWNQLAGFTRDEFANDADRSLLKEIEKVIRKWKTSNAWTEEIRDDPQLFPNFICPECEEPSFLYSIGYDAGAPVFISACPNNHETILTEFQMEEWTIETQPVEDAIESVDWDQLVEDESLLNEINKAVSNRKTSNTANAWTEERNPDQLRLVGCPHCGSDDLMANFEEGTIFVSCENCGNYFYYKDSYDYLSGKEEPGHPTVVEDTLANGEIYQGPTDSVDFESAIENLVSGQNNEFFDDEAADQLYAWANILQVLPELKEGAEKVVVDAREEIDNWTIDGIYQDPTYISAPDIEDMDDEEFVDVFGEDKTREEAMEESDEAFNWYWEESAQNHGAYQAAKYILDNFQQPA